MVAAVSDVPRPGSRVEVTYCGACGTALSAIAPPQQPDPPGVPDPPDPDSLEGRFQIRCAELIAEIQSVGFMPGGWIGRITNQGAVGAARELLATGRILPVTPWLLNQGRADLTMEREITRPQWTGLFDESDRAEAEARLERSAGEP